MGPKGWIAAGLLMAFLPSGQILAGPLGDETQCVPAGLPPFKTWELRMAKSMEVTDENEKSLPGLWALFTVAQRPIATIWVGNLLVSVDPETQNKDAAGWHDRGAVLADTTLRAEPRQRCEWFQPPPNEDKRS